MNDRTPARIESVVPTWQRDLMTRGEGRKARPVAEAIDRLPIGTRGLAGELIERAKLIASEHLVMVVVRGRRRRGERWGDAAIVTETGVA